MFLSKDAWEGNQLRPQSMNGWSYVEGNPTNFVDFIGFFKCDPVTGQCERGYGMCVVNGVWQGAYVNGKPCIVNPDNVQEGNAPSWPVGPQSGPAIVVPPKNIVFLNSCQCEHDDRDLTDWLVRELNSNAESPDTYRILVLNKTFDALWESSQFHPPQDPTQLQLRALAIDAKLAAFSYFTALVADKARWDFKHRIQSEFQGTSDGGEAIFLSLNNDTCEGWFDRSVPGNINFGYIGRVAGFSSFEIHGGATAAQAYDDVRKGKPIIRLDWANSMFDNPEDYAAIDVGITLYEQSNGGRISETGFSSVLQQYANQLDRRSQPSDAGQYRNPNWPYNNGYFNGEGFKLPGGVVIR